MVGSEMRAAPGEPPTAAAAPSGPAAADGEPWPWFGPTMLAIGLAFAVLTIVGWSSSTALAERGVPARATVVAKYTSPTEGGYELRVKFTFVAPAGGRTGDQTVSQAQFEALELGDPVAVVYLAEDPGINALAPYGLPSPILLLGALALEALFVAIGAGFTWRRLSGWMERRA